MTFLLEISDALAGECKQAMSTYLSCIKKVKGVNEGQCRELAKAYLSCRMERNLMAKDDFKNLGFQGPEEDPRPSKSTEESSAPTSTSTRTRT